MIYAIWIVASLIFLPLGFLGVVVPAVTGWQLPPQLMNLSALMLVSSVPGIAYLFVEQEW